MEIDIETIKAIFEIYGSLNPEFVKYGEIYLNTTENISGILSKINVKDKDVLSVAGKENIMRAYNEAVKNKYRFFSFGDAMFIK